MKPQVRNHPEERCGKENKKMTERKKVFICSPFRGDMEGNARTAAVYSRMACDLGYLPIAPHLLFPQLLDCEEVWVFGEATEGMQAEIAFATEQGKKIRFMEGGGADADSDGADTGYRM